MRCTIELCSKFITPSRLFLKDITIIDHKIHFEWTENKDEVLWFESYERAQHYYELGLWDDKPNFPISDDGYHYHYWILYENEYLTAMP